MGGKKNKDRRKSLARMKGRKDEANAGRNEEK